MKTTLDLPEEVLTEAKILAARRKITLKELVERVLRRELQPEPILDNPDPGRFEVGPFGILRIRKVPGVSPVTSEQVGAIQEALDGEDLQRAMSLHGS